MKNEPRVGVNAFERGPLFVYLYSFSPRGTPRSDAPA